MRWCAEFHDSQIAASSQRFSNVILDFAVLYLHSSIKNPGIDSGTVWTQAARLYFQNAAVLTGSVTLPATIVDGEITADGVTHKNCFPVPFQTSGQVECRLRLGDDSELRIVGAAARIELLGTPTYLEDFAGG